MMNLEFSTQVLLLQVTTKIKKESAFMNIKENAEETF